MDEIVEGQPFPSAETVLEEQLNISALRTSFYGCCVREANVEIHRHFIDKFLQSLGKRFGKIAAAEEIRMLAFNEKMQKLNAEELTTQTMLSRLEAAQAVSTSRRRRTKGPLGAASASSPTSQQDDAVAAQNSSEQNNFLQVSVRFEWKLGGTIRTRQYMLLVARFRSILAASECCEA